MREKRLRGIFSCRTPTTRRRPNERSLAARAIVVVVVIIVAGIRTIIRRDCARAVAAAHRRVVVLAGALDTFAEAAAAARATTARVENRRRAAASAAAAAAATAAYAEALEAADDAANARRRAADCERKTIERRVHNPFDLRNGIALQQRSLTPTRKLSRAKRWSRENLGRQRFVKKFVLIVAKRVTVARDEPIGRHYAFAFYLHGAARLEFEAVGAHERVVRRLAAVDFER